MSDKVQIKNQRPFTMVHNDFLDYEGLSSKEKLVLIMLMRYGNDASPSVSELSKKIGVSDRTVRYALKSLQEKGLIVKQARHTEDGGQMSNSYTIIDDPTRWTSPNSNSEDENMSTQELEEMAETLRSAGYTISPPSSLTSNQQTTSSKNAEQVQSTNSESKSDFSKEKPHFEEYSMDYLHQYFNYDLICSFKNPYGGLNFRENPNDLTILNTVFSVLYDMLNDPHPTIQIGGEEIPQETVRSKLFTLTFDAIIAVVDSYSKEDEPYDPEDWLKIALYNGNDPADS